MGTIPTTPRSAFLTWCQAHTSIFSASAVSIGLTPAQATAFAAATTAAAGSLTTQEVAKQAAKSATEAATGSFTDLHALAAQCVRSIRTFAENTGNVKVYQTAQIDPPAPAAPAPPPAQPADLSVGVDATSGQLTLTWKAANPAGTSGTSYIVKRRLPTQTAFEFLGVTGTKKFVDATLIAGPDTVQYTVQGQRGDSAGPVSQIFTINFGRAPGGGFTATVQDGGAESPRMAA